MVRIQHVEFAHTIKIQIKLHFHACILWLQMLWLRKAEDTWWQWWWRWWWRWWSKVRSSNIYSAMKANTKLKSFVFKMEEAIRLSNTNDSVKDNSSPHILRWMWPRWLLSIDLLDLDWRRQGKVPESIWRYRVRGVEKGNVQGKCRLCSRGIIPGYKPCMEYPVLRMETVQYEHRTEYQTEYLPVHLRTFPAKVGEMHGGALLRIRFISDPSHKSCTLRQMPSLYYCSR